MRNREVRRVLIVPTAFKETLDPSAVATAMAHGARRVWPDAELRLRPLSDGGSGLLDSCVALEGGTIERVEVTGPLGSPCMARLLRAGGGAIVESAEACGLQLVPVERRDPMAATTRGVGELLRKAAEGADRVRLGLGGSATVDGGVGMARALGWSFLDGRGGPLAEGAADLERLETIRVPADRLPVEVIALCDVDNPLVGPRGAARVFAPQKGATPDQVERLEAGLHRLAAVIEEQLGRRVSVLAGAGAAGGLGAGAVAFADARLVMGADWMMERAGLPDAIDESDLVITGEGRFDAQSRMGKLTGRIVDAARSRGVPVLLICGEIDGASPPGVVGRSSGGGRLDEAGIARLVESGCRELAGDGRL